MPMTSFPDHDCQCQHCHPEAFPTWDEPQSEGHVAIRWMTGSERMNTDVYLNGESLTDCDEAIAGDDGLVVRLRPHRCCERQAPVSNDGYCRYVQRGQVRVVKTIA